MAKSVGCDYFREPERSRLLDIINEPSKHCPQYQRCDAEGAVPACRIGPRFHRDLMKWFQDLITLSDVRGQRRLRNALRTLQKHKVLKACVLQRSLFAVKYEITADKQLRTAIEYEPIRLAAERCVGKAQAELRTLQTEILPKDVLRPEGPTLQKFTRDKTTLLQLAINALDALAEMHAYEATFVSPAIVRLIARVHRRQLTGELLHDCSSSQGEKRWWSELATLLDAGKAVALESDPQRADLHVGDKTAESLRQDVRKLSFEDVERLRSWFDIIEPDLYDRFQEDPEQEQIVMDVMGSEPRFSKFCSAMITCSLEFAGADASGRSTN